MMLLKQLDDPKWVMDNLADLVPFVKKAEEALEKIKEKVKYERQDLPFNGGVVKLSSYKKFKPKNIDDVLRRYPLVMNRDLYNISLSKTATETITDDDLFDIEMIDRISFTLSSNQPSNGQVNDTNQNDGPREVH